MLLGGVDYLLLGVLLNNEYVINKEEYDLTEVQAKVLGTKNPTNATVVLSKVVPKSCCYECYMSILRWNESWPSWWP